MNTGTNFYVPVSKKYTTGSKIFVVKKRRTNTTSSRSLAPLKNEKAPF